MHFNALEGCDVRASNPDSSVEGITDRLHKQLRCRKKLYANQTEAERWQQVYQLLFPNEIVPSPCMSTLFVEPYGFQKKKNQRPTWCREYLSLSFKLGCLANIFRL
jgi:hypothetical protein